MKKIFYIAGALALTACGSGKDAANKGNSSEDQAAKYAATITSKELSEHLYIYASDEFEGRETGEPGQKKAIEYLKKEYVSLNIPSPISKNDYYQEVPLTRKQTPEINFSVNNKSFKVVDDIVSIGDGYNATINANEVVYVGFGIEDDKYSSYNGVDVKGKIVLIKDGEPKNGDLFTISGTDKGSKWSTRQQYGAKREAAMAKGAKAILFYSPQMYPLVARSFGRSGGMALKDTKKNESNSKMFYFFVNSSIAKTILPAIDTDVETKKINTPVNFSYVEKTEEFNSENVLAFIKGSEKPDEVLVISAHLDHEGIKNGEVYNGADDDGSGTVALLEIAEAFKMAAKNGQTPKRSVLFLHVTGEEKGLLGSSYYADIDPVFPIANTIANLNIDMIGRIDPKREGDRNYIYLIGSDKLSTDLHNISEEVNKKYTNVVLDYTYNDENDPNRFYYRSDHYNFAKNNVPVIFYFNGTHDDYHKASDTPDKIEYDLLENRTRLVFHTAWELLNRENRIVVDKPTAKK